MAKVKVPVVGTVGKAIFIDPNATDGARLGINLYMADGSVATLEKLKDYLGVSDSIGGGNSGGVTQHRLLEGLTVGNDHPQYARRAENETIAGSWRFNGASDFYGQITVRAALRDVDASQGADKDALHATGDGHARWTPTGPRYLTQSDADHYWLADDFVRGHNIIGVRNAGAVVRLPHGLPSERIITVKDETGIGPVTVAVY